MSNPYLHEQYDAEDKVRAWLKGSRNITERGRRALAYIRTGRVLVPKLARQAQRRALRESTPDELHVYVAPCGRGVNKLGFTRKPIERHRGLRRELWRPRVRGFYRWVWIVQRGNARQIEAWSHAFARAVAEPIRLAEEYHRLPARLLAEIVQAVAGWLGYTIVQVVPALRIEGRVRIVAKRPTRP